MLTEPNHAIVSKMELLSTGAKAPFGWVVRASLYWLPAALGLTVLSGLIYVAVQQNFRQSANDPQIQLAEDAAAQLGAGQEAQSLVGSTKVDMAQSLAPFVIIYDQAGHPLASSAQLDGQTPAVTAGVFASVQQSGEDRLTWQPRDGVRIAAVVTRFGGAQPGFVLAGRSLREVESRESQLMQMVGLAWLAALAGSLVISALAVKAADTLTPRPKSNF